MADDTEFHHHHRNHCHDELRTDADYRSLINQGERNGDRTNDGVAVTGDRINTAGAAAALAAAHVGESVRDTACHTDQLVLEQNSRDREVMQSGFGGVHDRLCDAKAGIVNALGTGFTANSLAFCKTDDALAESKLATAVGFKDAIIAANVGFSAATVQLSTVAAAAQLEAAKNAAALSVEATRNANLLSVEATKNFYALSVEAVKNASAAELRAQQIAATAAAAAAECCCELKALIISEGAATRQQASDFRMRDLEARLNRIPTGVAITIPPGL